MARTRLHYLAAAVAVWAAIGLGATQTATAAAPVHVKVRVEGPTRTITQSTQVPITGTFAGHKLSGATALGALLAAGKQHHFPVGLQWFDGGGFFVSSVAGVHGRNAPRARKNMGKQARPRRGNMQDDEDGGRKIG